MWSAEPHWYPKALAVADSDVGSPFAWWGEQSQCQQVGGSYDDCPDFVGCVGKRLKVVDRAICGRVLDEGAKNSVDEFERLMVADDYFVAKGSGSGLTTSIVCG